MTNTQENLQPQKVQLIAIRSDIVLKNAAVIDHKPRMHNNATIGADDLLVFTCADKAHRSSIYKNSGLIIKEAGYDNHDLITDPYKALSIATLHNKPMRGKGEHRAYATALIVAPADLDSKFPNAEIIKVKSFDEFVKQYQKSFNHNQSIIEQSEKAIKDKLAAIAKAEKLEMEAEKLSKKSVILAKKNERRLVLEKMRAEREERKAKLSEQKPAGNMHHTDYRLQMASDIKGLNR